MSTTKHAVSALAVGALTLALTAPARTAAAIPPQAEEVADISAVYPDVEHGFVGFLNFTREGFCAWVAGGGKGDPPLLVPTSPAWEHTTGTGQIAGVAYGENLHLELWKFDPDAALEGPCEDTDDATDPFAAGVADVRSRDGDPYGTDDGHGVAYRGDTTIQAVLTGSDGNRYGYHMHVLDLVDPNGVWRQPDAAHITLTRLP